MSGGEFSPRKKCTERCFLVLSFISVSLLVYSAIDKKLYWMQPNCSVFLWIVLLYFKQHEHNCAIGYNCFEAPDDGNNAHPTQTSIK
jgi:hypothetical protein